MTIIQTGKVTDLSKDYKGWFIGHFVEQSSPFHSDQFELKWVERKKGEYKESAKEHGAYIKTLVVLIKGNIQYELLEADQTIQLINQGDFIFYEPFQFHKVTALENSVWLVIRWPSTK